LSSTEALWAASLRASSCENFCAFLTSLEMPSLKGGFRKGGRPIGRCGSSERRRGGISRSRDEVNACAGRGTRCSNLIVFEWAAIAVVVVVVAAAGALNVVVNFARLVCWCCSWSNLWCMRMSSFAFASTAFLASISAARASVATRPAFRYVDCWATCLACSSFALMRLFSSWWLRGLVPGAQVGRLLCIEDNAQGMIEMKLTCSVRMYTSVVRQFNRVPYSGKYWSYNGQHLTVSLTVCCG